MTRVLGRKQTENGGPFDQGENQGPRTQRPIVEPPVMG